MSSIELSELKVYSIGIVAEDKKLRGEDGKPNRIVEVIPIEDTPMLDGELTSDKKTGSVKSQDSQGSEYEVNLQSSKSIKATWLPFGSSNRFTAPDVRRGERVMLYRYSDEDRYYWTTLFDDLRLRKLETVIYAFSGTRDEKADSVNPENFYFLEVSTHRGLVHFSTSKANGEFCKFDIQINAKEGLIKIVDDIGQKFVFDSKEHQLAMTNVDGTYMEINKKNFTINVPETYTLNAKNVVENVQENINTKAGKTINEKSTNFSMEASGSANVKAGGALKIDGNTTTITKNVALK